MSEAAKGFVDSTKHNTIGPDYFGFYACEVVGLLSEDDNSLPSPSQTPESSKPKHDSSGKEATSLSSVPLFSNNLSLSDFKKENLRALLRQGVGVLSEEVDEVLHPVIAMQNLQSQLRRKRCQSSHLDVVPDGDAEHLPQKKLKDKASSDEVARSNGHGTEPIVCSKQGAEVGGSEVDSDLQYLLESDSVYVEEIIRKYSDEYYATLDHMGKKLEELLDTVVSKCRPMTLAEKQQLRKLIQNLPAKNLDRAVEIIQSKKTSLPKSCQDLYIDLEKEVIKRSECEQGIIAKMYPKDDATLWRLYYYVEAVENAKKLAA